MEMHGTSSDPSAQSGCAASSAAAAAAAHRWYEGPRMEPTGNIIVPDEMDVFFHSMSDGSGNPVNPASYYTSPAAAAAARAAAVHGYHRPSPHGKRRLEWMESEQQTGFGTPMGSGAVLGFGV